MILRLITFAIISFTSLPNSGKEILTSAEMHHDLAVLHSTLINLHPGLYRYNTSRQIENYFNDASRYCDNDRSEASFYLLLSKLTALIKCGHTYLNPLNLDDSISGRILPQTVVPFFFKVLNNKMIVTHSVIPEQHVKTGDEILSINGVTIKRIIDSLILVSRADGRNALGKKINNINETPDEADNKSLFDIYYPLFFPTKSNEYTIKFKPAGSSQILNTKIEFITFSKRTLLFESIYGKVPKAELTWRYRKVNSSTAYMKFGTFAFWNSKFNTKNFIDSIFNDLRTHHSIKNLVIDIRGNEGGDNSGSYILKYISKEQILCDTSSRSCYRFLKIPDSLQKYLTTWDRSFKQPKDPNNYKLNELGLYQEINKKYPCETSSDPSYKFSGHVILLTDAKNSSAGYEMARDFKQYHLGEIIGETTGGTKQGINGGEFLFLTLPNSKFEIDIPLIFNYYPNEPDEGIKPDHFVSTTQKDIMINRDAQLDKAIQLLK